MSRHSAPRRIASRVVRASYVLRAEYSVLDSPEGSPPRPCYPRSLLSAALTVDNVPQVEEMRQRLEEKNRMIEKKTQAAMQAQQERNRMNTELTELKDHMDIKDRKINVLQRKVSSSARSSPTQLSLVSLKLPYTAEPSRPSVQDDPQTTSSTFHPPPVRESSSKRLVYHVFSRGLVASAFVFIAHPHPRGGDCRARERCAKSRLIAIHNWKRREGGGGQAKTLYGKIVGSK